MAKVKHLGSSENGHNDTRKLALGEYPVSENPQSKKSELAEVMAFSPTYNSYLVVTRGSGGDPNQPGRRQLQGIPRKVDHPGMVAPLPVGCIVVVNWELGFPYISGVLNVNTVRGDVEGGVQEPFSLGAAGASVAVNDNTDEAAQGYYRFPGTPMDIVGGDWVEVTPDGNYMAALRGNYNVMNAGKDKKAKFEQFGDKDLTRLTTGDYEMYTDFGVLEMYNEEGRCGLSFKAAADQLHESGGGEEQWTFKLDIGDAGDFFNMEVLNTQGLTQAKFHISPDGRVTIIGTNGLDLINGGTAPQHQETAGPVIQRFLDKFTSIIEGVYHQEVHSSRTVEISESDKEVVGFNKSTSVNNHEIKSIGGSRQETIAGGTPLDATPLNIAVETQVLNGSYHLEVGNSTLGASPAAKAGITLAVNNGNVVIGENPSPLAPPAQKATVSLNTLQPNSVALGGNADPAFGNLAIQHAVIYEQLEIFLVALMAAFDAHIHMPPGNTPPTVLMSGTVGTFLSVARSIRVLIGA